MHPSSHLSNVAVIVLTGGGSRRLGGVHKPGVDLAGSSIITRVLDAVADLPTVVVGSGQGIDGHVTVVRESPSGSGPVAAIAEGCTHLPVATSTCVLLAGDLPFLTPQHISALTSELRGHELATYVDGDGHPQWLCAAWSLDALCRRLKEVGDPVGRSLRELADGVRRVDLPDPHHLSDDIDTPADLAAARLRWADGRPK